MHKIDGEGHSSNTFTGGDPTIPIMPTRVTADWLNAVQGELVYAIEQGGQTLNKFDNGQLWAALVAKFGRLGSANTWTGNQAFGGTVSVAELATLSKGAAIPNTENYSFSSARTGYLMVPSFDFVPDATVTTGGPALVEFENEVWLRAGTSAAIYHCTFRLPEGATIAQITMLSTAGYTSAQTITWGVRKITKGAIGQFVSRVDVPAPGTVSRPHSALVTGSRTPLFQQIYGTDLASGDAVIAPSNGYFQAFVSLPAVGAAADGCYFGGLHIRYTLTKLLPAT